MGGWDGISRFGLYTYFAALRRLRDHCSTGGRATSGVSKSGGRIKRLREKIRRLPFKGQPPDLFPFTGSATARPAIAQ
jgi:hypothetical protein